MAINYVIADTNGFGCAICGTEIRKGDEYVVCPDCAAIFCKSCGEDGTFENHSCEETEEDVGQDEGDDEPRFIFRGESCYYSCEWVSEKEFFFDFTPKKNVNFVDEEGDAYLIHCEYFQNGKENVGQLFAFNRLYEQESVNACDYFKDRLTDEECEYIKNFMQNLMKD